MGLAQGGESRERVCSGRDGGGPDADAPPPALPVPPLQASAPGSAVDYPLHSLVLHTNYTATVHGLRGPNLTSPASITFTTGTSGVGEVLGGQEGLISIFSSPSPPRAGGPSGFGGQGSDPPHSSAHLD